MSWQKEAATVMHLVEAAMAVKEPNADDLARALDVTLVHTGNVAKWASFSGSYLDGPIEKVDFSVRNDIGNGSVFLRARPNAKHVLEREMIDLDRFGDRPMPENNPVFPEGVLTYEYEIERGPTYLKKVAFQFTAKTHKFVFAKVAWMRTAAKA